MSKSKFEVRMELSKSDLKALDKDLDKLLTGIGRELASAPKMQPMVDKIQKGMSENAMKFTNHEVWAHNKEVARRAGLIDFDSPLMVTGQLVNDFIYHAGKPKISQLPYSNEFVVGMFTWADKVRKRPTSRHILNETAKKRGYGKIDEEAQKFTHIKTTDLVRMIMKSPRYPIMDSIMSLYDKDVTLHMERLINEAFSKRK